MDEKQYASHRLFNYQIKIKKKLRLKQIYKDDCRDIIPLSIGLGLRGGKFLKVIERFQEYPCVVRILKF